MNIEYKKVQITWLFTFIYFFKIWLIIGGKIQQLILLPTSLPKSTVIMQMRWLNMATLPLWPQELDILISAHLLYKMWIHYDPKKIKKYMAMCGEEMEIV